MKRLSLITALVLLAPSARAEEFFIHDGDRVVFYGDSITEQRLYTSYIEAYTLSRFPHWKLFFRNAGWGGDTSWGGLSRLERDVLALKPSVVTVDFGMNDHGYRAFDTNTFTHYVQSQAGLVKTLKQHDVRVALLTPQPIEPKMPDPDKDVKNVSLRQFSDGLREVAGKEGARFVDQFDPYMALMLKARAGDPTAVIGGGDPVHPGAPGHTLMAWAILKGLNAPSLVAAAELDAAAARVVAAKGCQITNVKADAGTLSFDRQDEALPMPLDVRAGPALKLAPVLDDLDQYLLQVTGLAPGRYALTIDGAPAATLSQEDLAKGCNLAQADGPIRTQAQQVLQLVVEKNNLYQTRWRQVQLYAFPAWASGPEADALRAKELARLDQAIAAVESQLNVVRLPKLRHFELKPLAP